MDILFWIVFTVLTIGAIIGGICLGKLRLRADDVVEDLDIVIEYLENEIHKRNH